MSHVRQIQARGARAAVNRGAAEGARRLTGYWPGEDGEADQAKEAASEKRT
ncbi:MAG TPA: hypothetical protein VIZ43_06930 [Trebonia sp.]